MLEKRKECRVIQKATGNCGTCEVKALQGLQSKNHDEFQFPISETYFSCYFYTSKLIL